MNENSIGIDEWVSGSSMNICEKWMKDGWWRSEDGWEGWIVERWMKSRIVKKWR